MTITFSAATLAVQLASRALVPPHSGHNENSFAIMKTGSVSSFTYPTKNSTAWNFTTLTQPSTSACMTKTVNSTETVTLAPSSSANLERNAAYKPSLVASTQEWAHYGQACPDPHLLPQSMFSALASQSPAPTPQGDLWPVHWLSPRLSNNSTLTASAPLPMSNPSATLLSTNSAIVSNLTVRTDSPAKQSPTVVVIIPITTMSIGAPMLPRANAVTLQGVHNNVRDGTDSINANIADLLDPVYFGPTDAQTSTIRITVTAATPTTSSVKEPTVTSNIMSTIIKTVTLLLTTPQLSTTAQPSYKSNPTSYLPGSPEPVVHTSIVSADPRCPYPFPGIYCGKPKTTLITETKSGETSSTIVPTSTMQTGKLKGDGWCPYPGQAC